VLLGANFSVFDGTSWVDPVSAEKVQEELSKLDTHSASILSLASELSALTIRGTTSLVLITKDNLSSSARIIEEILLREIPEDKVKDIDRCLHGLIWGKPYIQLGPDTFLKFLDAAFAEDTIPVPSDQPMYLPSCKGPIGSNLFQHLATFGPDAPSLWNTAGSKIPVVDRKRKGSDSADAQPAVPSEIIILPKPVLVALKEWNKILDDGVVCFNLKERARDYRGHVVKEEGIRKKIWKSLQEGLLRHLEEKEGPQAKKQRMTEAVLDVKDMLDLL